MVDDFRDYDKFKATYGVASGLISTTGIALIIDDGHTIDQVMDDLTELTRDDPDTALELFKVIVIMCAKNSVDLYSKENPGWRTEVENASKGRN